MTAVSKERLMVSPELAALFGQAQHHDRAGRLDEAEALCRAILRRLPNETAVLHLLGVILCRTGRLVEGAEMLAGVTAAQPGNIAALRALGDAFHALGHMAESVIAYQRILFLQPGDADAHLRLGLSRQALGQGTGAIAAFRMAAALDPANADIRVTLGMALEAAGDKAAALTAYADAIRRDADNAPAFLGLGNVLADQGRAAEAMAAYARALHLAPDWPDALTNLGLALQADGQVDQALALHRRAARLAPDAANVHLNLGTALQLAGQGAAAVDSYRRAVALAPDNAAHLSNLGQALAELGAEPCRMDEALAVHDRAAALAPDNGVVRFNQALAWLLAGDDARGWPAYAWRWRGGVDELADRGFTVPEWRGEDLAGRTLLVHAEQGLGDTLQFARFLGRLPADGRVVAEVQPPLLALMRDGLVQDGGAVVEVMARGRPLPAFDLHAPLMSLPAALGVRDAAGLATPAPYLTADPDRTRAWRERRAPGTLTIGIAWSGNPKHRADRLRSVPLADLAGPLAALPGVTLVPVQTDRRRGDEEMLSALGIADIALDGFTDTAALVAGLDLVITVDTAVAHLAGALGRPVWLLLPYAPDWRWRLGGQDTPWYPATRLLRQERQGDWAPVIRQVAAALKAHRSAPTVTQLTSGMIPMPL
ncbi:tetratricopeptide repeat protein [Nitrospirillum sp. BR 11164]|uniref:tetratricopeptide repeat protein n=1 Tax=Nitrospirillum sp. BR 11164 TaxID=3104324 RepID=UPI002AFDE772|nr:tetratricopeptide repeat protein [Nitrospirillum sp. BR 11164]MEA1651970.1 tetratricopeptide repeat protein [Nitrospirillum sp. BR 11164]